MGINSQKLLEIVSLDTGINDGHVRVMSPLFENVGIKLQVIDPHNRDDAPLGALYRILSYKPEEYIPRNEYREYDYAWVMSDGTIVPRKK